MLYNIIASYHYNFKENWWTKLDELAKKPLVLGPISARFWSKFGLQNFFPWILSPLLLYIVASYHCMRFQGKTMKQTGKNDKKPSFGSNFGQLGPNLGGQNFLYKIWPQQSLDIMVSYHHVQYQKKLMLQSWENLVTDRRTESHFIGRCPTNVERPKKKKSFSLFMAIFYAWKYNFFLWTMTKCVSFSLMS